MADFQTSTTLHTTNKTIKLGFRTQPLVTESPEDRLQSLNLLHVRKAKVNRFNINLSMDTDELESLERDRLLGLDTKFNQRTQEKRFIKINDILTNPTDFTEIDFCFMGDQSSDQKVLNLAKVLSRHHSLKRAALDFLWCQNLTQNGIKNFVKTLFKLNRLNQFSLAYKNFYQSEKAAKDISLMTRTFTRYFTQTQVQLSLQDNNISYHLKGLENTDMPGVAFGYIKSPMSTDDPVKLLETIKKLSHSINGIVSIKLDFQGWNELANTHLIALKELLSKFSGLTSFELNLTKCNGITDIGMFMIKNILANQPNLKHLKLGLSNIHITDNGVSAISDAVSKLTNLKSLDIDFSGVKNISKVSILGETLSRLRLLEVLAIQFEGCDKITDDDIKQINFPHDKLHENLNTIILNFKGCREITNEGVKDFSIGISSLRNLQHLALRLNRCPKITDDGLKQLAFTMSQNFHSLKGISLSFSTCQKITDQGISYLASEIGESNLNLEQIDLQFTLCHELTYKGLETTLTNLSKQLKKLKKLSLDFSSCAKITDEALKELKSDLEFYFEALQELTLCLSSKQVSEKGLNSLMTLFKNLNHLSLQLRRSQLLTDEGVKRLGSHIMMQFDKLKKLDLDFESCELISDDGIKQLVSDFASRLKNLESLSLNLSKCNQVTKEVKGHVKRTLSFLPNINL